MKVKSEGEVAQSCPTHRDPMDCSPPGSSVYGIFQARVLEWGAIAFSHIYVGRCSIYLYLTFLTGYVTYQRSQWHPTPGLLPGNSHGRRSLIGCSPWGRKEPDTTEQLHFHLLPMRKSEITYKHFLELVTSERSFNTR